MEERKWRVYEEWLVTISERQLSGAWWVLSFHISWRELLPCSNFWWEWIGEAMPRRNKTRTSCHPSIFWWEWIGGLNIVDLAFMFLFYPQKISHFLNFCFVFVNRSAFQQQCLTLWWIWDKENKTRTSFHPKFGKDKKQE